MSDETKRDVVIASRSTLLDITIYKLCCLISLGFCIFCTKLYYNVSQKADRSFNMTGTYILCPTLGCHFE